MVGLQKLFLLLIFSFTFAYGSLQDKSAIVYYGDEISYPIVGIHDYIIVQPKHTNTFTHGFSLYKDKIYAYLSIGEIELNAHGYEDINTSWIVAKNEAWKSDVLDIRNKEYQQFIFTHQIEPLLAKGFKNFFFDTLDSYYFYAKKPEDIVQSQQALASFINEFHKRYPNAKLVVNRGFGIIDQIHNSIDAVLFESYYQGLSGKDLTYHPVSDTDRAWLDTQLLKIRKYNLDIIAVDYMPKPSNSSRVVKQLQNKGFIPYIATKELDDYGISSKNALKREILTLIDESKYDRTLQSAHFEGAVVFEYLGYIQKLHNVQKGLPDPKKLSRYAGVVIWLEEYTLGQQQLLKWLDLVRKKNIPIVFVGNFGSNFESDELASFGISFEKNISPTKKIIQQDPMIGFEITPPLSFSSKLINLTDGTKLLTYVYQNAKNSTPAALTPWGGYVVEEALLSKINEDNIWVINPFEFFKKALRLEDLIVPDPTTENGKRLLFSHIDGDGIMNKVEGDFGQYSGDVILNKVLKPYKIPHSVSVIGAEIDPNGLFPEISSKLIDITKKMFALKNVEPASHTFTHPFFWGKIVDDNLSSQYRLKVPKYNFSLQNELKNTLNTINENYLPQGKLPKANTIFWSGDCAPRENALQYIYKNNILAINGGDTTISRTSPWLTRIAPFGIRRGEFYQIYTGAQNENVFTNNWLGPFWGYKRVTQTFELTNSPRRFKPVDIYYHLYSGSKRASLEALKYVFNWALAQDLYPIFTSEYIPKVMDMYEVSMAKEGDQWLVEGFRDLKTLRLEDFQSFIDLNNSKGVVGITQFENHTYLSLDNSMKHLITITSENKNHAYMLGANGKLVDFNNTNKTKKYNFVGHVDLDLSFHLEPNCEIDATPKAKELLKDGNTTTLKYKNVKEANVTLECKKL